MARITGAASIPRRGGLGVNAAIVLFNAVLVAALWGAVFVLLHIEREATIRAAVERNDHLAIAVEQYVTRTIENADAAIRYLMREYRQLGPDADLARFVTTYTIDSRSITGIVLANERGDAISTSYPETPARWTNVADREHFSVHVERNTGRLHVGKPVTGRITGKAGIAVTRRIDRADGSFAGVAMALIEPARFTDVLHEAALRPLDIISVVGVDGVTRARLRGTVATWGEDISKSSLFARQAARPTGNYFAEGQLDGVPRFFSYRTLPDYGLIATVGAAQSDVMQPFYRSRRTYFWSAGVTTAIIAGFAVLLMNALAAQRRVADDLRETEIRFRSIFEQAGIGMAMVALDDGRLLRTNAALADMLGYGVDELSRLTCKEIAVPDDHEADRALLAAMSAGARDRYRIEKRYCRRDGTHLWGKLTATLVCDADGRPQFMIGMLEDVTERKNAEDAVRGYSARLRQLSRRLMVVEEDERRRLGRELHDRAGANLSALLLSLEVLRRSLSASVLEKLGGRLDDFDALLRETVALLRGVLTELRPPALDELGLHAALKQHVQGLSRRLGIDIEVTGAEPQPRLGPGVEISLFRIAQEALNNATKHAHASRITVSIAQQDGAVVLGIADDGRGFDVAARQDGATSLGMLTMTERAEGIGAHLSVRSSVAAGTEVTVYVPHPGSASA